MSRRYVTDKIKRVVKPRIKSNGSEVVKVELNQKQELEQQIRFLLRELRKTKSMEERMNIRNRIWKLEPELKMIKLQGVA